MMDIFRRLTDAAMGKAFSGIYRKHNWFHGSGSGSLPENTTVYRKFLEHFIRTHRIKSVLDLGCGDWQSSKFIDWDGARYIGIDVVPSLIETNKKLYANETVQFSCGDFSPCVLPPADLIIIKDVLQHWPNDQVDLFLQRLADCNFKYALVTNTCQSIDISDPDNPKPIQEDINRAIKIGESRAFDPLLPPFSIEGSEVLQYASIKRHAPIQDIKTVVLLKK
ncbi:MAG TPA: class I SAM-dependent methyltransferase [Candidatus Saccharimonadales bacterium]|nr:class I SAM-dependent methyltransferase [Candidatus Saccharimonadales bacterium]